MALWTRRERDPKKALQELIGDYELPCFPATAMKALSLLRRDDAEVAQIADELRGDPGIHVKVLQAVNSAAFGLRTQVTNLENAVSLLGASRVEAIVLAVAVRSSVPVARGLDLARFWRTSALRACLAKVLTAKVDPANASEAFTAAFLQDMAIPIMFETRGADYAEIYYRSTEDPTYVLHKVEQSTYGHDHALLGSLMAENWGLPSPLVAAISGHHEESDPTEGPVWSQVTELIRAVAPLRDEEDPTESLIALQQPWSRLLGVEPEAVAEIVAVSVDEANRLAAALGRPAPGAKRVA